MGFLDELKNKYAQETPKEEDAVKPSEPTTGFLGELESKYKNAPVEQPKSFLNELERKYDTDPESLKKRKASGEPLPVEKERIIFEADRARPITEQVGAATKGLISGLSIQVPKLWQGAKDLVKAGKQFEKQAALKYLDLQLPDVAVNYISGKTPEQRQKDFEDAAKKEWFEARSFTSGAVQALEEDTNAAIRGLMYGSAPTDILQETPAGKIAWETIKSTGPTGFASKLISERLSNVGVTDLKPQTKEESFQRSLAREGMRGMEEQEYKQFPERTSAALAYYADSPVGEKLGEALGQPGKQFSQNLVEEIKSNAIIPNENVAFLGNMLGPFDITFMGAGPLARASSKVFDKSIELGLKGLTKPTIAGLHPIEGLGAVIRGTGQVTQKAARKLSDFLVGSEDSFITKLVEPVVAATRRPGINLEGVGRVARAGVLLARGGTEGVLKRRVLSARVFLGKSRIKR